MRTSGASEVGGWLVSVRVGSCVGVRNREPRRTTNETTSKSSRNSPIHRHVQPEDSSPNNQLPLHRPPIQPQLVQQSQIRPLSLTATSSDSSFIIGEDLGSVVDELTEVFLVVYVSRVLGEVGGEEVDAVG